MLVIALMSCFALTSCGDDDKEEPDNPSVNKSELLIIGEWSRNESGNSYYRIVFLEDGTGYDKVMHGSSYNIDETFKWSVKGSNLSIVWEGSDRESFTIVSVTARELIIRDSDDPDRFIYFTRVN